MWFDYSLDQLFQYLALFHATDRKIFFASLTLPHRRPRHTLPMPSPLLTHNRSSAVKTQRNQVSRSPAEIFFQPSSQITFFFFCNSTLEFSRPTLKRVGFYECQDGSEFSPCTLLRSLRGPMFPFHRRIAPR